MIKPFKDSRAADDMSENYKKEILVESWKTAETSLRISSNFFMNFHIERMQLKSRKFHTIFMKIRNK